MSTEIKPGQVWAWQDVDGAKGPHNFRFEIIEAGTDVTYQYRDAAGFDPETMYAASAEVIMAKAYRVDREPDSTPAPLDPSKVKAGDTVTLERNGVTVAGPVESIGIRPPERPELKLADSRSYDLDGYEPWTLTAHQPAPEPELGWKPGTVAEGTVNGTIVRGLIGRDDNGTGDVFTYWNEFARHMSITGHVPDDVRPLVVIDPATVDVDALVDAAIKSAQGKGYWPDRVVGAHMIRHVVAALGIEAS